MANSSSRCATEICQPPPSFRSATFLQRRAQCVFPLKTAHRRASRPHRKCQTHARAIQKWMWPFHPNSLTRYPDQYAKPRRSPALSIVSAVARRTTSRRTAAAARERVVGHQRLRRQRTGSGVGGGYPRHLPRVGSKYPQATTVRVYRPLSVIVSVTDADAGASGESWSWANQNDRDERTNSLLITLRGATWKSLGHHQKLDVVLAQSSSKPSSSKSISIMPRHRRQLYPEEPLPASGYFKGIGAINNAVSLLLSPGYNAAAVFRAASAIWLP